jgi:hypothetical protein
VHQKKMALWLSFPVDVGAGGIARGSSARRRSHSAWAPAHKNFLLKILAPPFESFISQGTKKEDKCPLF